MLLRKALRTETAAGRYKGAIHVHTRYSDGSGTVPDVLDAARAAGLDFVIVSDHDTLEARRDWPDGWYDGVLLVIGAEISPEGRGHCLALGVQDVEHYRWMTAGEYLPLIRRQGGLAFVAHPEGKRKRRFGVNLEAWLHWDNPLFQGIEVWSFMHDWIASLGYLKLAGHLFHPYEKLRGPNQAVLACWDKCALRRPVAGIAGVDAHAVQLLLRRWRIFPYEMLFRSTVSVVGCQEFTGDGAGDVRRLLEGLASGDVTMVNRAACDAEGFAFCALGPTGRVNQGGEILLEKGVRVVVESPVKAHLNVVHNGVSMARQHGAVLEVPVTSSGVYRAEAHLDGKPWAFSNHVFVGTPDEIERRRRDL